MWKNVPSPNVEESFRKFLDPDLDADDFQNVIGSYLSTVKLSWIFMKIRSVFLRKVANRQTLRQADIQTPGIT